MTDQPHAHADPHAAADRQPWTILLLIAVAQFMVVLDITVVNVALPAIGEALGFAGGDLPWVVTAYVLFAGGLLLLGGRAADLLGRRRVFLTGLSTFTLASLAAALAPSPELLVVARAVQGLGAALLTPSALSILTTTYTGAQRATALSAWGAIGSGGAAAGMLLGGVLTSWLSWEWIFLVNVPIGLLTGLAAIRLIPATPAPGNARQLDLRGAAAVITGLGLLVYTLQGTAEHGWGSARTLASIAAAAALLALFAALERSAAHPLVAPRTWRQRSLVAGSTVMLGATGVLVGAFFLSSLYLQQELGASALETGLGFLPIAAAIGLGAHAAAHLLRHAGSRVVAAIGFALMTVAAILLAGLPDDATYAADLLPAFVAMGLGVGLGFPAASVTAMDGVGHDGAGVASGLLATAHELGAAFGVAVFGAIAAAGGTAAAGFEDAFTVAAFASTALAALALFVLPAVRPAAGAHVAVH